MTGTWPGFAIRSHAPPGRGPPIRAGSGRILRSTTITIDHPKEPS